MAKDLLYKRMSEQEWIQKSIRKLERRIRKSISENNTIREEAESFEEEHDYILKGDKGG